MALPVVRTTRPVRYVRPTSCDWQFDRQFEQVVNAFLTGGTRPSGSWAPRANVSSTDEAYSVELELPGLKREDVNIELTDKTLTVSGEYSQPEDETAEQRSTLRSGGFRFHRTLPADADRDAVVANLADGVLRLTLPRVAAPAPRRVEITQG